MFKLIRYNMFTKYWLCDGQSRSDLLESENDLLPLSLILLLLIIYFLFIIILGTTGSWLTWQDSSCSVTCGSGTRTRRRQCSPATATCIGASTSTVPCDTNARCPGGSSNNILDEKIKAKI